MAGRSIIWTKWSSRVQVAGIMARVQVAGIMARVQVAGIAAKVHSGELPAALGMIDRWQGGYAWGSKAPQHALTFSLKG